MNEPPSLGVHVMTGETLLKLLRRVQYGENADEVYAEMYANADHLSAADLFGIEEDG
jgi:hypothetical protein